MLEDRFILFGEWVYARHSVHYRRLPHYFFEFDIYDKQEARFPRPGTTARAARRDRHPHGARSSIAARSTREQLRGPDRPVTVRQRVREPVHGAHGQPDGGALPANRGEGRVTGRAKFVRPEFVEKVKQSEHWQHQAMVPNLLAEGAEIWS